MDLIEQAIVGGIRWWLWHDQLRCCLAEAGAE
jgi:hypothetical protein